jgi:hypothetical protein
MYGIIFQRRTGVLHFKNNPTKEEHKAVSSTSRIQVHDFHLILLMKFVLQLLTNVLGQAL